MRCAHEIEMERGKDTRWEMGVGRRKGRGEEGSERGEEKGMHCTNDN